MLAGARESAIALQHRGPDSSQAAGYSPASAAAHPQPSMPDLSQLGLLDDEDEEMEDLEGQQLADMTAWLQEIRQHGQAPAHLVRPLESEPVGLAMSHC